MTGDGCAVCNPTMKREIDCYNEGHAEAEKDTAEAVIRYAKANQYNMPMNKTSYADDKHDQGYEDIIEFCTKEFLGEKNEKI